MAEAPKSSNARSSGARAAAPQSAANHYLAHHKKVAKSTFHSLVRTPISSLFTCAVLGIALVLPALLTSLLSNIESLGKDWDGSAQITLLLKKGVPLVDGEALSKSIAQRSTVTTSQFIDNDSALTSFKERFEFADAIEYLDSNPLPHVIIVKPSDALTTIEHIEQLKESLLTFPEVDDAILDIVWVKRLQSIINMLQRAVTVIGIMLALVVILVLGNTIRLAIENRKEEIIVIKLVGGTDGFVRRPFLYMGVFYGFGASLVSWMLLIIIIAILNGPVEALAKSYQSNFSLSSLSFESTLMLFLIGTGLGWFSSWLAVRKHLDDIEPS
jgi:cell division transport system permease protein